MKTREFLAILAGCALFVFVLSIGMGKEIKRLEVVAEYNCAHYGYAINKHAGEELCAPMEK